MTSRDEGSQGIPTMEEAQGKAKQTATSAQERVQGAAASAQQRAHEVVSQNEQRLESAFGLLSIVLAVLGAFVLLAPDKAAFGLLSLVKSVLGAFIRLAPDKVALFAFGPGVFHPSEATAAIIRQCVHQAKDGRIPNAATRAITWMTGPENKLPLAYEVDLRIIGSAILGASFVSYLLKRAAAAGVLNQKPYKRLNFALFTWAALSAGISLARKELWNSQGLMVWLGFLTTTALLTAPLTLAQNPVGTIQETIGDAKHVRSGRGKLFLFLSAFFFVEGLGILASPNLAQRGLSGPAIDLNDPIIGLLFSLVAASAHIIVPAAVFNLKSAFDQGRLANLTSFVNNAVLFTVAATHVVELTRSAVSGNAGPIAPVLFAAWTTAFVTSLTHFPYTVEGRDW